MEGRYYLDGGAIRKSTMVLTNVCRRNYGARNTNIKTQGANESYEGYAETRGENAMESMMSPSREGGSTMVDHNVETNYGGSH